MILKVGAAMAAFGWLCIGGYAVLFDSYPPTRDSNAVVFFVAVTIIGMVVVVVEMLLLIWRMDDE